MSIPSTSIKLLPSSLIQRAAPRIRSILSSYTNGGGENLNQAEIEDALSPYFHPRPEEAASTMSVTSKPLISSREFSEWQTPYMPLLTDRQLELTLVEIRRRQRHYRRNAKQISSSSTTLSTKRDAAIFVPLCTVNGVPSILFTRRSTNLSSHASQISFPGGYFDECLDTTKNTDETYCNVLGNVEDRLANTALRELEEELCFDLHRIRKSSSLSKELPFLSVLGQTQPVPSMTGNRVTPIVGQFNYDLSHFSTRDFKCLFPGNPDELDWIFTVPISDLLSNESSEPLKKWGDQDLASTKGKYEYWGPVFPVPKDDRKNDGDRIWGLTASVLRPLLRKVFEPVFSQELENGKGRHNIMSRL
ncbi:hypothetical protein HJC23_000958 [Cyclotella cryptica]|uniref:Nudix hydrolase domain-containing protein n=1 Tax=Cyclotella cryptica TaxID=29204 RepID=A0ABD3QMC9_9STRA|eukprot:CCRYP_004069-RA/>CCRYP_004069-RA protein AED:0.00 eAED:0.00 QI:53/1/1/1/0/0/2/1179/360